MNRRRKLEGPKILSSFLKKIKKNIKNIPSFKKEVKGVLRENTTTLLNTILGGGVVLFASDIHLEPQKEKARLRVRVDGVLQDIVYFDKKTYKSLLTRIKLLSKAKLNITDKPQDGRFTIKTPNAKIEIRTSTLPAEHGESIVMRILNPESLKGLEELGLRKDLLDTFKKEVQKPNGMIIVTGPTGSGKTTTLYAFLKHLRNPEIKIITIEDPIEYHLKGVSQTQVDPGKGYTFSHGLESIVRQDPDVILVGEIRDFDTAKIALQAALTGHLVFTTLHTNDAAGTIPRLIDLGEKPASIAPGINMVIAQRLVREVCKECAAPSKVSQEELKTFKKQLSNLPGNIEIPKINKNLEILKTKGCKRCNFTGYRGRRGVFEALLIDEEMEEFIYSEPPVSKLRQKAIDKGMITMYQAGLIDVVKKKTTFEEIERVIK